MWCSQFQGVKVNCSLLICLCTDVVIKTEVDTDDYTECSQYDHQPHAGIFGFVRGGQVND